METIVVNLSASNRNAEVDISEGIKKIKIEVSRENCKDILCEVVNSNGNAKGKPLNKWLPQIKSPIKQIRFMMNNFSIKPIEIKISF